MHDMDSREERTQTSAFGVGRREGHDSSAFYARFTPPALSEDEQVNRPADVLGELGRGRIFHGSSTDMHQLPDASVALVVTSPPYFVGKEYELAVTGEADSTTRVPGTYIEFLDMLRNVFAECERVLEPGGRIAVNVANLGRKPYRSLSADVINILQDDLRLLLRGEVIWEKASTSSGSCAWGSFAKASNPVLRDMTERLIIASKGRFARALSLKERRARGLPHESTLANDEFVDVTKDVWRIDSESATRIGHPAPFPVELPRRLIDLYTYKDDIVLDPFAGSGTTLVAAARTGRIGVGYDTDAAYVELAQKRLDAELDRAAQRDDAIRRIESAPPVQQQQLVAELPLEDRQEHFQARAVQEGKKAQDIAKLRLQEAGFDNVDEKARHPSGVVEFNFLLTSPDGSRQWWVDVSGAFTTSRPGLQRTDAVWKLLGRLHVLQALADGQDRPHTGVLVLTSNLPKPGSPGDRALRAVGPNVIFDAIELYDPAGLQRLAQYASSSDPAPLPGFWTDADLVESPR
jgi:DNA modification methylase